MKLSNFLPVLGMVQSQERKPEMVVRRHFKSETSNLAWKLLFSSGTSTDNKVISPLSVLSAVYMLGAGAGGETRASLINSLLDLGNIENPEIVREVRVRMT